MFPWRGSSPKSSKIDQNRGPKLIKKVPDFLAKDGTPAGVSPSKTGVVRTTSIKRSFLDISVLTRNSIGGVPVLAFQIDQKSTLFGSAKTLECNCSPAKETSLLTSKMQFAVYAVYTARARTPPGRPSDPPTGLFDPKSMFRWLLNTKNRSKYDLWKVPKNTCIKQFPRQGNITFSPPKPGGVRPPVRPGAVRARAVHTP